MQWNEFLELLCCPSCRGPIDLDQGPKKFSCDTCRHTYPIIDGIPVLLPYNVEEKFDELFNRYWDPEEQAKLYDAQMEGINEFWRYNQEAEIYALVKLYDPGKLDIVLDAGCGNGRFMDTFPSHSVKVAVDASLNMLKICKDKKRGDFLVCCDVEHLPFKSNTFSTVISCRVLQHIHDQAAAVADMTRVARPKGDVIIESYNTWNLKTLYKNIRMSSLTKYLDPLFRPLFPSKSPLGDWGMEYDNYTSWSEVSTWLRRKGVRKITGRGAGFGHHRFLLHYSLLDILFRKRNSAAIQWIYDRYFGLEKAIGHLPPFRYLMEKVVLKGVKENPSPSE